MSIRIKKQKEETEIGDDKAASSGSFYSKGVAVNASAQNIDFWQYSSVAGEQAKMHSFGECV